MNGGSERKPYSLYNQSVPVEAQPKMIEHGAGGPPRYVLTGNPVSWLVDAFGCIPFFHTSTGNRDQPANIAVDDSIQGYQYDVGSIQGGVGYGNFQAGGDLRTSSNPIIMGVPANSVPRQPTGQWGSRKTRKV